MEEPISAVDPLYEALMMISCDEGNIVTSQQGLGLSDLDSFLSEQQLLDKALYECEHELMMESSIKSPLSEVFDIKNITVVAKIDGELTEVLDSEAATDAPIQKSASSGNLNYTDMAQHEALMIQNFPEFPQLDLGAVYGMRRAFSEGDIQDRRLELKTWVLSNLPLTESSSAASPKTVGRSFRDTGTRRGGGISDPKSSTLAERLLQTINQGSEGGLRKPWRGVRSSRRKTESSFDRTRQNRARTRTRSSWKGKVYIITLCW
ncbi:PREDICTED: uncharacterized protein LOC104811921 isoform X4 [Tarenaya hassleriana]|nr:PREDICTED: uncharacterized protein LOC104811921 isoform X4 [Tarenaya hassleriana]XP_010537094.1 PREDICTED: uncharacterized protein LOC104811921 isoform X4 [Tarenaya hassleriana]